jgi:hypothetical protein
MIWSTIRDRMQAPCGLENFTSFRSLGWWGMNGETSAPGERGTGRWRRINRTGGSARVTALVVCGGSILAFFISGGADDWAKPGPWLFVAVPVLMLGRSIFFGVYLCETQVKIVSWYWVYRLDRTAVSRVLTGNYNGWVVRWSGGIHFYSANVLMIGFEFTDGRERFYPATAMRHSRAKMAAQELRREMGLQPVRTDDGPKHRQSVPNSE